MNNKHIILDPGHGGTSGQDLFRQGPTSEREEWINLRVAKCLKPVLESQGFVVSLTRSKDVNLALQDRIDFAITCKADLFLSIHHASCSPVDRSLNFPFLYMHGSLDKQNKFHLAKSFQKELSRAGRGQALIYSDHWVFNSGLFVLAQLEKNNIPAVLTEFSFFSHPEEELKLKSVEYCQYEAKVLCQAVVNYFKSSDSYNLQPLKFPFEYKKQLDLIKSAILESDASHDWRQYFTSGKKLLTNLDDQSALISFEKSLALNAYHPDIISLLEAMYVCTKKLGLSEYGDNIDNLLASVW